MVAADSTAVRRCCATGRCVDGDAALVVSLTAVDTPGRSVSLFNFLERATFVLATATMHLMEKKKLSLASVKCLLVVFARFVIR